ncbi:TrbC/VirB2 family protein [Cupriavidus pauculus]|uniref:TrbC/VirB2 family protein n=1 Tax=Cupriavidus pauculus TaxID=82633 RepID=UPI0038575E37
MLKNRIRHAGHGALAFALIAVSGAGHAGSPNSSGSGMPWEGPIDKILASIQGPVARAFLIIAIVVTGLMMAFGEHGSGFKKVMGIAFGGSIVVTAISFISSLFGATF